MDLRAVHVLDTHIRRRSTALRGHDAQVQGDRVRRRHPCWNRSPADHGRRATRLVRGLHAGPVKADYLGTTLRTATARAIAAATTGILLGCETGRSPCLAAPRGLELRTEPW